MGTVPVLPSLSVSLILLPEALLYTLGIAFTSRLIGSENTTIPELQHDSLAPAFPTTSARCFFGSDLTLLHLAGHEHCSRQHELVHREPAVGSAPSASQGP